MSDIAITVENLSKSYWVGHQSARTNGHSNLREALTREVRNFSRKALDFTRGRQIVQGDEIEQFWALRDVSFEVKRGEVLGIIGRNGAGKSTLLKVLSRITEPDRGRVKLRGRVASLLEVGTGFHPELTGRENIFLNGAILGMTRAEIKAKFDEIVAFAEIERFLDTPVKRYSSGMYVRLAFSVAAHLEPEILIVDEVLAVGDVEFQRKCLGKMSEVAGGDRTILFVSHNLAAIETLCPRCLHLISGEVAADSTSEAVISSYLQRNQGAVAASQPEARQLDNGLVLERTQLSKSVLRSGEPLEIEFEFSADRPGRMRECAVLFYSPRDVRIGLIDLRERGTIPMRYSEGRFKIRTELDSFPVSEMNVRVGLYIDSDHFTGDILNLAKLEVLAARPSEGFAMYSLEQRGYVAMNATSSVVLGPSTRDDAVEAGE